ncbi:YcfL family protein [Colwellia sp. BRX10-3]|uniref:YcfL family protein n=1 Tax=Colwellia sp. BRX10-3 TaxID=2759844 RepID=UPI0015F6568C|nr:YcfL family protein [Colwellia sp. BRX10-3]MBA6391949.1 YcfL family protein [Colwellia sp. BRX10-3]
MLTSKNTLCTRQKITGSLAVILVSAIVIAGCANKKPPVTAGTGTSAMTQGDDFSKHLEVHNTDLAKRLFISDVKSRKSNDLLEINLTLTSRYEKSQKLQYHFNWFDEAGFVIEAGKTPWVPLELHGKQSTTLRGLAPNINVSTFSVYVREIPEKAYKY